MSEPTRMDRFWAKVGKGSDDECWPWSAARNSEGYGSFWNGTRAVGAHRFAYENLVGPVPDGLTLDHACRNRACVNPAHLEPVTNRTNILRGVGPTAIHAAKTHCVRGHELTGSNLVPRQTTERQCRQCHNETQRANYAANLDERRAKKREQKRRWRAAREQTLNTEPL